MTHPSYAFDGEDTILWELVGDKTDGFYIDVGANGPVAGCVSKSFYDVGWRGVVVEPLPYLTEPLRLAQPGSTVYDWALGSSFGSAVLRSSSECDHWASLDPAVAQDKLLDLEYTVEVHTLAFLCGLSVPSGTEIDWLKVDVEGWEDQVLRSGDWELFRPQYLCIESFVPHNYPEPSHMSWEPFILDKGYEHVTTHLLNRFYRRS